VERDIQKRRFSNGLRILLEKDEKMRSCSLGIWIASGSGYETAEQAGVSHFIEHMLFKGTARRSARDIAEQMDEIGGVLNAYTAKEYTCFYARALTDHVTQAFDILADMVTAPRLDAGDMAIEKGVIAEEIAMYEDSPEDLCMDLFYESVWPENPFGRNILGTRETVAAMRPAVLRRHMEAFYSPKRMVVAFCGNFDTDSVLELCESYFGDLRNPEGSAPASGIAYRKALRLCPKETEQNQIILGFPGVASPDRRKYAIQLFSSLLGASSSSRLFRRIREELGLVYSIESFHVPHQSAGLFGVTMGVSPEAEEQAIRETLQVMRSFSEAVTPKELSRAKEQAVASLIMSFESSATRLSHAGRSELLYDRIRSEDEMVANIRAVTAEDVLDAARLVTDPENLSVCAVGQVRGQEFYKDFLC